MAFSSASCPNSPKSICDSPAGLARTRFQVVGQPNHPVGGSGAAGQRSMPSRSGPGCPHEHTRRRNCHDARRPASKCPRPSALPSPDPGQNTACHRIGRRPPVYRMVVILMQGRSRRLWQAANPKVGTRGQVSGISSACWRGRMTANHTAPEALPTLTRVYHDGLLEQLQPSPQSTTHAPALRPVSVREGALMAQPGSHAG